MKTGKYRTADGKAQIEWEVEQKENGPEFSASGDYDGGSGQCIEEIANAYPHDVMVQRIATVWREYHLNGMNPGTPEQTRAVEAWRKLNAGNSRANDYGETVKMLKSANLYEVPPSEGLTATGGFPEEVISGQRGYRYGERWVYRPIPQSVLDEIASWSSAPHPNGSLVDHKAKTFLADNGLKLRITLSDSKEAPWELAGHHYRVTLSRNAPQWRGGPQDNFQPKRVVFDFWGSFADMQEGKDPEPYSVLSRIASDIHTPETFEEFCSEYGYGADSIKALQTFRRADRFAKRLRAFFTDSEAEQLSEIQ